ncbi:MAG: extracellular solute-binding protein [Treponema sp.]|nr:extracellular solute-binding protein [Treponema sp.]
MKKIIAVASALAVLSCGTVFAQNAKKDDSGKVKLEMYYYKQENQEGLKNIVKAFEAENPDISIDMLIIPNDADAAMSARAAQGALPAIMQMQSYSRVKEYAEKGYLVDLSKEQALSKVVPSSLPAVTYNGKQYALPMDFAGIGIIYNKDIFKKYHIKTPATYRDLEKACKTLKSNNIVPFAALLKENWSVGHFITMIHTALLQEKNISPDKFVADMNAGKTSYGVVDTAKLFKIMDFYRANMNDNAAEMGGGEQQQSFAKGESAMMVNGLWAYVDAKKLNPKLNAGFIPFPVYNDEKLNKLYADVDSTFGVSSQSTKEEQAASIKFINWLSTPKAQKLWVSEYKLTNSFKGGDFTSLGGPFDDLMKSVGAKGSLPWAFSQYPSEVFEDACKNGAQQYMMKARSASDVIKTIDAQWQAAAAKK